MDSIIQKSKKELINIIKEEWDQIIIGFSGGKDSTCVVQLVLDCIIENKINTPVRILSSDTLIENPLITKQIHNMHKQINEISLKYNLNVETKILYPKKENTYLYNTIIKGYATPLNIGGRWCTRTLKVDPMKEYYKNISEKTLLLTGVRLDESSSRKKNIEKMLNGKSIKKIRENLYSFPIIKDWKLSDVWDYIQDITRNDPYYLNTSTLWEIYRDATLEDTCPSSVDISVGNGSKSCGKSRYGCYLCPLVRKDTSLEANIKNGHEELKGYLELRNFYMSRCYDPVFRDRFNKKKQVRFKEVKYDQLNDLIAFKLLDKKIKGNLGDFIVVNVTNLEEAKEIILNQNVRIKEKETLYKKGSKYFVPTTGQLSLEFRVSLLQKVISVEENYNIKVLTDVERKTMLDWLNKTTIEGSGKIYDFAEEL